MLTENKRTGFESADIASDLEETFGLRFSAQELQSTHTVGEIYDLILSKLPFVAVNHGTKIQIFFELRNELNEKKFRPSTPIISIIPLKWRDVAKTEFSSKIPELKHFRRHPKWVHWLIFLVVIGGIPLAWKYSWFIFPGTLLMAFLLRRLARVLDVIEPTTAIRDIVDIRAELEFLKRAKLTGTYNPQEVWEILKTTIARYLDTRKVKITRDSSFVEDLGLSE